MRIARAAGGAPPGRDAAGQRLWAVQTGIFLMLGWLALDGVDNLGTGMLFSVLGAGIGLWLVPGEPYPLRPLRLTAFALHFLLASFRGGIDVALLALQPRLPLQPALVVHQLSLPAGLPRTLMLSVVSLLPGTLSVAVDAAGRMQVHVLVHEAEHGFVALEGRIARLFGLPPPSVGGGGD